MKTFLLSAGLVFAMSATASANPTFPNASINNGLTTVQSPLQASLSACLSTESSSRAIRACSKSLRAAAPNDDVRSQLYTRRALHQLALGRHDDAAKDFSRAGILSDDLAIESLGHGFAAMMDNDLATARRKFEDCNNQGSIAPLAEYGLGLTHQMAGETDAAREAYTRALTLRPGWVAVSEQMATLTVK